MTTEQQREVLRLIAGRKLRIEQMRQRKYEQLGFDFEEIPEIGELF
ncbi:putative oxidoreductase [Psychrobacter sp. JCM 18901]|nr:putative oxidoreductase [Psychrobacter sp. JCM 18901]